MGKNSREKIKGKELAVVYQIMSVSRRNKNEQIRENKWKAREKRLVEKQQARKQEKQKENFA